MTRYVEGVCKSCNEPRYCRAGNGKCETCHDAAQQRGGRTLANRLPGVLPQAKKAGESAQ